MSDLIDDLDRLNELLGAISLECEGMTIGEVDGYVAGLIVCPESVLLAQWLPTVWGGESGLRSSTVRTRSRLQCSTTTTGSPGNWPWRRRPRRRSWRSTGPTAACCESRGSTASSGRCGCAPTPGT